MENAASFSDPDETGEQLFRQLNRLRMTGALCNAVLGTNDGANFRVHKVVMSLCSDYFRTLFTTSLKDSFNGSPRSNTYFLIPDVPSSILRTIIDFAYSGKVIVTKNNVTDILTVADQLNVTGMVEKCVNFMLVNMTPENCVGIWQFGRDYLVPKLEQEAKRFILKHFVDISTNSEEFLHLKAKSLITILREDSLNARHELLVWNAIKRWTHYKREKRRNFMSCLLQCVRLALLPIQEFQQIMDDLQVYRDIQCRQYVSMVCNYILNEFEKASNLAENMNALSMFTSRYPHNLIFAVGGNTDHKNSIEVYDCRADLWKLISVEKFCLQSMCTQVVNIGTYVYFIGGQQGFEISNYCHRLDISDFTLLNIASMQERRCLLSVAALNDTIYAIGGYDGHVHLQTVEHYDPILNQWTYVSPMLEKRSEASAAALRNRIFVVGGFDGSEQLLSAECYFADIDQWFLLPPMLRCRMGVGCVAMDNSIYAIGGFDGEALLNTVEKYCIKNSQWFPMKSMKTARWHFAAVVLENKIYVMGGNTESYHEKTDQAECFDPANFQWKSIEPMKISRSVFSACTISDVKDVTPYIRDNQFRCLLNNELTRDTMDFLQL